MTKGVGEHSATSILEPVAPGQIASVSCYVYSPVLFTRPPYGLLQPGETDSLVSAGKDWWHTLIHLFPCMC